MSAKVKIDFQIAGSQEVARALQSISGRAQRVAAGQARAQTSANQQQVAGAKRTSAQILSDEEARVRAQLALIQKTNRARVEATRVQMQAEQQLGETLNKIAADKAKHAAKEKADRAAARAETKAAASAAREHAAAASNRRQRAGEIAGGAVAGAKAGGLLVAGAVGLSAASAARSQMALEERAALLRSASGKSQKDFDSVDQAKKLSNLTGTSADEVMGGFEKLSGKAGGGGLVEFKDQFVDLAKVARGAGVSMTDMGDVLGTLYNRGVKGKDVVKVVESLVQQGKDGAVEFKDLATMLDASSGALGRFQMDDAGRVTTAGGLSQFARTFGKKSAEEATDAVNDLARDLGSKGENIQRLTGGSATTVHVKGKKTKRLVDGKMVETTEGDSTKTVYKGGVEVGTDATRAQLRDVNKLLPDIIEGAVKSGNADKLMGEGGFTGNSTAIVGPLLQAFTQGIKKNKEGRFELAGAGEKGEVTGRAAVEAMLQQFQAANVEAGTSAKAFADVMNTSQAKLAVAMETLKNDLGTKLAPAITKAIENPKATAAAVVAGGAVLGAGHAVAGQLGSLALDKLLPKTIGTMPVTAGTVIVSGGAPSVPGAPGGAGATAAGAAAGGASKLAKFSAAAGAGIAAFGLTTAALEYADSGTQERRQKAQTPINESIGLAFKIRQGKGTEEDFSRVKSLMADLEKAKSESTWFDRATGDKTGERAGAAAQQLQEALGKAQIKLDAGSSITIANADAIAAPIAEAVRASNLQHPKAQRE